VSTPQTRWIAALRREPLRAEQQRATARQRRWQAAEDGKQALGTYSAVAEILGISRQAITDIREAATTATPGETFPDHMEIRLPGAGGQVWTTAEWEELPADQRTGAAERTLYFWRARAHTAQQVAESLQSAQNAVAEGMDEVADWEAPDVDRQLRAAISEAGAPEWAPMIGDRRAAVTHIQLLGDMITSHQSVAREAWRMVDLWKPRLS
jgi:hypothetical protein